MGGGVFADKFRQDEPTSEPVPSPEAVEPIVCADLSPTTAHRVVRRVGQMPPGRIARSDVSAARPPTATAATRIRPMATAVIRRDLDGATPVRREDHVGAIDMAVPAGCFDDSFQRWEEKMTATMTKKFGVHGARQRGPTKRSDELIAYRQRLKDAAREQARADVDTAIQQQAGAHLATEQAFYGLAAKKDVYATAKESVATTMARSVTDVVQQCWTGEQGALLAEANRRARDAAWEVLRSDPTSPRRQRAASAAARRAGEAYLREQFATASTVAQAIKQKVIKPGQATEEQQDAEVPDSLDQETLTGAVRQQVTADHRGSDAVTKVIEADSVDAGISKFAKLLDQALPASGDQLALSIELNIPIASGPGYVGIAFTGKAARGIEGAMTAGVPSWGDPRRLEIMFDLSVKVGADLIGLDVNAGANFFVRAGGDSTALCMKSLSYGAYRTFTKASRHAGNWWAGSGKGIESKTHYAEAWAAMVEEQAFKEGGGYVDIGGGIGASASLKAKVGGTGFEAGLAGGLAAFHRYDDESLSASLPDTYAVPVADKAAALDRRRDVKGSVGGAWSASGSFGIAIAGQDITFAASASGSIGVPNWGVEVTGTITYDGGPTSSLAERWGAGLATGIAGALKDVIARAGKGGSANGAVLTGATEATQIFNAGFDNAITNGLAEAWTVAGSQSSAAGELVAGESGLAWQAAEPVQDAAGLASSSTLQVAVLFGYNGTSVVARLEIRSGRELAVSGTIGSVGVKFTSSKSRRLFGVGYDEGPDGEGQWNAEALGVRARTRTSQRDPGGHRT